MDNDFVERLKLHYRDCIENNDKAHRMDHMDSVYKEAVDINVSLKLNIPDKHIVIMAYCHDLFTVYRDNHHILGYTHLMTTKEWFMDNVSDKERHLMASAVKEHRASWKGEYTSIYSELLASADRGRPKGIETLLDRSKQYAMSKLGKSQEEAGRHAYRHVKEKFGSEGYSRYPDIYHRLYGDMLKERTKTIDSL